MDNEQGWTRLAAAVKKRRDDKGWTQLDVATRGGISIDRIQAIESARTDRYASSTLAKLERGLEWEPGSCRAILAGGEPTPLEQPPEPSPTPRIPVRSLAELEERMNEMDEEIAKLRQELSEERRLRDQQQRRETI